ncbi:MAG: serine hydrolase [Acidimicrobiales bacterium]
MLRARARGALALAVIVLAACSVASSPRPAATTSAATSTTSTTSSTTQLPHPRLQDVVDTFTEAQDVAFSVVAVNLTTGERGERLADRVVLSASLYKLFVAAELLRRIDDAELFGDASAGDAHGRTVAACVEAMVVDSDNACGEAGLALVGFGALDDDLHAAGYPSTSLAEPQHTSAADVALFLQRAHDGTLNGPGHRSSSALLYELLLRQRVDDRLPQGLPPGTAIAHKTGDRLFWAHDAGIFRAPGGDVLLAVLSGPWPSPCCDADHPGPAEQLAFRAIAELGSIVYDASGA